MRILISAYACAPDTGSEPEVGLQIALAAASKHEVWVITREDNLASLKWFLSDHPLRARIHLVGHSVGGPAARFRERGGLFTRHWYYDRWQRSLSDVAVRLDEEFDFDVVHHATYASYWTRTGVAAVNKPLVWGPVGGGVLPPRRLLPLMGLKGALGDLVRLSSRPLMAMVCGARKTARGASVVLVQNPETASILRTVNATILPNALVAAQSIKLFEAPTADERAQMPVNVVMAGRLIGWKAPALALLALKQVLNPAATLTVYGDGPQSAALRRLARRHGMTDRILFRGKVSRSELLMAIRQAAVVIHPALHEEGGFVVAEALALGTPMVALDRGGPPVIATFWPSAPNRSVSPSSPTQTARAFASAIEELIGLRGPVDSRPADRFRNELMRSYAEAALSEHP